jgi:tetratricopeptide (TPR) repeat protein
MATKKSSVKPISKFKKETVIFTASKETQNLSLFPTINRFITETWKFFIVSFASGLLIIAIVFQTMNLIKNMKEEKSLMATREKTIAELKYWEQITGQYKNYRDGYFKVALLQYRLGNIEEARLNLKKTLELDPNFEKGRNLEKILNKA